MYAAVCCLCFKVYMSYVLWKYQYKTQPIYVLKKQNYEKRADYFTPVEVRVYVPEK